MDTIPKDINYYNLRLQDKDPEDIAEDFRDAIWENDGNLDILTEVWAAGKCFIDSLYWEDEHTCLRPPLPEGLERLEHSLNNVAHYVLHLTNDMEPIGSNML